MILTIGKKNVQGMNGFLHLVHLRKKMQVISITVSITSHSFMTWIIQEVAVAHLMICGLPVFYQLLLFLGSGQDCVLSVFPEPVCFNSST